MSATGRTVPQPGRPRRRQRPGRHSSDHPYGRSCARTPVRSHLSGAVAGGGKAALAAKALSAAGKVGRFVDPMTYIFKGASFGLTKVGDAMAGLKGLGTIEIPPLPDNVFTLPEGAVRLTDGTIDLPVGAALPEGAIRLADGTV